MTRNTPPAALDEPVDERWLAHLRDVTAGVTPPTPADPHDMSRVAVRRTRARRAAFATGGGLTAVAAVAVTAFALSTSATGGTLLPGGSPAAVSAPADVAGGGAADPGVVPEGWHAHDLDDLSYALPPDVVSSGPTKDEPGETSQMWHHDGEDVPPYIRVARLTPEYEYYDTTASGLTSVPGEGAEGFDLPGSSTATVERGTPDLRAAMGLSTEGDPQVTPVRILVHPADSDVRYVITMTLPVGESGEDSELVDAFVGTLSLD